MESALNVETAQREWFNVYPKGTGSSRLGWNAGNGACATGGIPNDVDFMRAVVLYMIEETCVDVNRVFAAGLFVRVFVIDLRVPLAVLTFSSSRGRRGTYASTKCSSSSSGYSACASALPRA